MRLRRLSRALQEENTKQIENANAAATLPCSIFYVFYKRRHSLIILFALKKMEEGAVVEIFTCARNNHFNCNGQECAYDACVACTEYGSIYCHEHKMCELPCSFPGCTNRVNFDGYLRANDPIPCSDHKICRCVYRAKHHPWNIRYMWRKNVLHALDRKMNQLSQSVADVEKLALEQEKLGVLRCLYELQVCRNCNAAFTSNCCGNFCNTCSKTHVMCGGCYRTFFHRDSRKGYHGRCLSCLPQGNKVRQILRIWMHSKALLAMYRRHAKGDERLVEFFANYETYTLPAVAAFMMGGSPTPVSVALDATPYFLLTMCEMLPKDVLNLILHMLERGTAL